MYIVQTGYTPAGRDKYRKFETLEAARQYCAGYFETSGIVLSIVKKEKRA